MRQGSGSRSHPSALSGTARLPLTRHQGLDHRDFQNWLPGSPWCQITLAFMSKETGTSHQGWKQMNRPWSKFGLTRCTETSMKKKREREKEENFQSADPTEMRRGRLEQNIGIRLKGVELSLHLIFPLRSRVLKAGIRGQASQKPTSMPEALHYSSVVRTF